MNRLALLAALIAAPIIVAAQSPPVSVPVSVTSAGFTAVVAANPGLRFDVLSIALTSDASVDVTIRSGVRDLTGPIHLQARTPFVWTAIDGAPLSGKLGAPIGLYLSGTASVTGMLCFSSIDGSSTSWYVAANGNNSNTGVSEDAPLLTFAGLSGNALDGYSVLLRAGDTFQGVALALSGVSGLTVTRYGDGADPIIDGDDTAHCVTMTGCTSVDVSEITFTNSQGPNANVTAFRLTGANVGILIRDVTITNTDHAIQCLTSPSGSFTIEDAVITGCYTDGVSVDGTVVGRVNRCTITGTGMVQQGTGPGDALTSHGSAYFVAEDCTLTGNWRGVYNINQGGRSTANVLRRCFITQAQGVGAVSHNGTIGGGPAGGYTILENCRIIVTGTAATVNVLAEQGATCEIYGCTLVNRSTNALAGCVSSVSGFAVDRGTIHRVGNGALIVGSLAGSWIGGNNLYYPTTGTPFIWSAPMSYASWLAATGEAGSVSGDPLLVAWTGSTAADLDLQAGSPAIDAGKSLAVVLGASVDFYGTSRPKGAAWDIGAHEK